MRKIIILVISLVFIGCISLNKDLVNSEGQRINCSAIGAGYIGAPAALVMYNNCINKHKALGYTEGEQAANLPTNPQSKNQELITRFLEKGYSNPIQHKKSNDYYLVNTNAIESGEFPKQISLVAIYPKEKLLQRPDKTQFYGTHQIEYFTIHNTDKASITKAEFFTKDMALAHSDSTLKDFNIGKDSILEKHLSYLAK